MELTLKQKTAFGIGAVGKDMVYALSASYVMYYYQDVLGLSASFVGLVLMAARFFDAFNDPFMGVLVAKTRTRWGRFRPWIFSGTLLNALVLYALFAAPVMDEAALMVYFSVVYILWGVTYTMMDIPYWSMIPAVTRTPKDRENLSMVGRTCAGVGSALIAMFTMLLVGALGGDSERAGFRWVALIVAVIFAVTELVCCISMKETTPSEMKTATVKEMFSALFRNDQAMVVVGSIVLINSALYLTSNFIIYFFKYDLGGAGWKATYTLFSTVGGAAQILGMMVLYPLLRKKFSSTQVFHLSLVLALCGYGTLLVFCLTGLSHSLALLCIPGVVVFACNGMLTVLTTLFLSNSVDYGQLKTGRREESVIFSMQTFVVKAASGVAVFLTGIGLDLIGLVGNTEETGPVAVQSAGTLLGLRLMMTVLPMLVLAGALVLFRRKFTLSDDHAAEISAQLHGKKEGVWIRYGKGGKPEKSTTYKNDEKNGEEITYFTDGTPEKSSNYLNGKLNGVTKEFYFESGKCKSEYTFKNGKREGAYKRYFDTGKLREEGCCEADSEVYRKEYYANGKLKSVAERKGGGWNTIERYDSEGNKE